MKIKLVFLTLLTMLAFAANSILCRLALVNHDNSPISFTILRLASGALALIYFFIKHRKAESLKPKAKIILPSLMLFSYAVFFSLSYVRISSGIGALILFASVQLTMMSISFFRGQKLERNEKIGFLIAICGFIYLLLPGLQMPSPLGAGLMLVAGISWGVYSIMGQGSANPILSTSRNFLFTVPLLIILAFCFPFQLSAAGIVFAIVSGAVTSGLGYILWYVVLKQLQTSTAAIVQLSVPAIAAIGGSLFLSETPTLRLLVSSGLIFSGIIIKLQNRKIS